MKLLKGIHETLYPFTVYLIFARLDGKFFMFPEYEYGVRSKSPRNFVVAFYSEVLDDLIRKTDIAMYHAKRNKEPVFQ
ncbi:hypothetical protein [Thermotoga sp. SG1]|uniref:hypothetical protein n=1 Tax=Thermotoga sp. SG1 TaxID=126739 RepID=UPI000C78B3FC|nr:hypothetical protein [Thermotoga sp. SG1]